MPILLDSLLCHDCEPKNENTMTNVVEFTYTDVQEILQASLTILKGKCKTN